MTSHYQTAADIFANWRDDVLSGEPPVLYSLGDGELQQIEIGPGRIVLLGGQPGAGKTALCGQLLIDGLRLNPELRVLWANVEMPPATLLERALARVSGIDATTILRRQLGDDHQDRLDRGLETLQAVAERLAFLEPPFDLDNVAGAADEFDAGLIVLDYVQRFRHGEHSDHRSAIDSLMDYLRKFATAGVAVLVVAALARQKDRSGKSSYTGINLASFRGSSELEFGCDDAYVLVVNPKDEDEVVLCHLKSRHGQCQDIVLTFDRPHQSFTANESASTGDEWTPEKGIVQAQLAAAWERRNGKASK